jgi:hypothetical protein
MLLLATTAIRLERCHDLRRNMNQPQGSELSVEISIFPDGETITLIYLLSLYI